MKKVILAVVAMFATVSMSSAQMFVGGSLGFGLTGGKDKGASTSIDKTSTFSFDFSPKVGYYLNDNFAVGLEVGLNSWSRKTPKEQFGGSDDLKNSSFGWEIDAFARYSLVKFNNFSVLLEGEIGIGGETSKTKIGATETKGNPVSTFGIGVLPVLSYSISDKWSIETSLDFLALGFWSETEKNANDKKNKSIDNSFGLSINNGTNSIISNTLNIGFIYKF